MSEPPPGALASYPRVELVQVTTWTCPTCRLVNTLTRDPVTRLIPCGRCGRMVRWTH
jgi:hypothetical protein